MKSCAGNISVLSGMVTSSTNFAWSVHAPGVPTGVDVAVGMGDEVAVGAVVVVGVTGAEVTVTKG
jgi:hypothetical protein